MTDNDDKKSPPTAPPAGGPRILAPQGPGTSNPGARPPTPGAPVVNDPGSQGSQGRGARPPKAATLPPGPSKSAELRPRKKRHELAADRCSSPSSRSAARSSGSRRSTGPLSFPLPRFDGLFGSGPKSAPAPATRQETAAPEKPAAKPAVAPAPHLHQLQHQRAKEAVAPDDEQKRRMAAVEERLASATTQSQTDKRTIEGLQTRLADSERQAKGLQQRVETLEQGTCRSAPSPAREARPAAAVPREAREAQAPAAADRPAERPADRQIQAAPPVPAIRPSAPARHRLPATPPPAPQAVAAPGTAIAATLAARYRNPVTLRFGRNQDVLRADHQQQLSQIAAAVAPCANIGLMIRGFTDSRGSDKRNAELSLKRADLAARFVEGRGVARNRLSVSSFASAAPRGIKRHGCGARP